MNNVVVRIHPEHHAIAESGVRKKADGAAVDRTERGRDTACSDAGINRERAAIVLDEAEAGDGTARNRNEVAGALRDAVIGREGRAETQTAVGTVVEQAIVEGGDCGL